MACSETPKSGEIASSGLRCGPADDLAFVLSGLLAFAYFIGHAPRDFYPFGNGGEAAVLFCFIFLYIAAAGGGPWSVDALRERK